MAVTCQQWKYTFVHMAGQGKTQEIREKKKTAGQDVDDNNEKVHIG